QLTAKIGSASFAQDRNQTNLWLYNNTTPGPLLKAKKGEVLEVEFINKLDQPTTIHWHGIRNINEMDGVPDLTQAAVEPDDKFTYRFPVNDAGTFWYHAHNKSWEQVARGLYGALIVLDEHETFEDDRDHLIVADDWLLDDNSQIDF
ncbi:MAG: multicopper oxidase domain-containing protein, partial [Paracoccaceae bacterium]